MNTTEQIDSQKTGKFSTIIIWSAALIITILSAYYQRITGPSYPLKNKVVFQGREISYELPRSGNSYENPLIKVKAPIDNMKGVLLWKRYETKDDLTRAEMVLVEGVLRGELPKQPAMDKLAYNVRLSADNSEITIPGEPVVIRFKDEVPIFYLGLHILGMFGALLLAVRTGLEPFKKEPQFKKFTFWTLGFLTFGGFVMGAVVTKYAFGLYWTGFPVGMDLTDNKTLLSWIVWMITAVMVFKSKKPILWVAIASVVTLLIFLIPHSLVL